MNPLKTAHENCVGCKACMPMCPMLDQFCDSPKTILNRLMDGEILKDLAYACTLCGHCSHVCSYDVDLKSTFMNERIKVMSQDRPNKDYVVKFHQSNSFSKLFSTGINDVHKKMFFPGCALVASKPELIQPIYNDLKSYDADTGLMLNCCANPTQVFGDTVSFAKYENHLNHLFQGMNVEEVIVACPNCYNTLNEISDLKVTMLWHVLKEHKTFEKINQTVTVHDPCPSRYHSHVHDDIRHILNQMDITVVESSYAKENTLCCGSGGMVKVTNPKVALNQKITRQDTLEGKVVTYCQECVESLSDDKHEVIHILDLIYKSNSKTYNLLEKWINRYQVKRRFK